MAAPSSSSILNEASVGLRAAADKLPGRPNASTVWRWIRKGVIVRDGQSIKLRAARVGTRWFTSDEAIAEFVTALSGGDTAAPPSHPALTPKARKRAADRAHDQLAEALGTK